MKLSKLLAVIVAISLASGVFLFEELCFGGATKETIKYLFFMTLIVIWFSFTMDEHKVNFPIVILFTCGVFLGHMLYRFVFNMEDLNLIDMSKTVGFEFVGLTVYYYLSLLTNEKTKE